MSVVYIVLIFFYDILECSVERTKSDTAESEMSCNYTISKSMIS